MKSASGLKEALQIGTDHAVDFTGTPTDFQERSHQNFLPDKLKTAEKGLRLAGMGPKIDEFELSMNRTVEMAAPAARSIFKDALPKMTFDDARKILTGGQSRSDAARIFDITDCVVGKALHGLFYILGQEEKEIRTDPAAQIPPLLKEAFGKR